MLSLEKIRKIDPELSSLSDTELLEIEGALYAMGQLAFDVWWTRKNGSKNPIRSLDNSPISGIVKPCNQKKEKQQ